ncbi:hypothetical protein UA08_00676 [Talaromyces atroroseus]|uniref:Protein kinase domain-containing protein n=1 Tax=Talaromyces atroroseus TaxID=1441469 RepID=A0A225B2K4_TALAT|nr:hypothetical protein UA08_00676 [Talaromyces atroroseus]OKL63948.1 hypothetical protein UA08_00676 [Talaromyces atroroseus]
MAPALAPQKRRLSASRNDFNPAFNYPCAGFPSGSIGFGALHTSHMLAVPSFPTLAPEVTKVARLTFSKSPRPLGAGLSSTPPLASPKNNSNRSVPTSTSRMSGSSSMRNLFRRTTTHRQTARGKLSREFRESDCTASPTVRSISPSTSQAVARHDHGGSVPARKTSRLRKVTSRLSLKERISFSTVPHQRLSLKRLFQSPSAGHSLRQRDVPDIAIPAKTGAGLKSRQLGTDMSESFKVDWCELNDEFASGRKIPGKGGKPIGRGATAIVRTMYRKGRSREVLYAVKEFRKCGRNEDKVQYENMVKSEFSIAQSLHHPNIVETVRLCKHSGRWNHVMEYCEYGELYLLIKQGYLRDIDNLCFFKQLLRGVAHLHQNGIAHRDIKPENLLVTAEGQLKITDFGVSEVFSGTHPGLKSSNGGDSNENSRDIRKCSPGICGSIPYVSPEVLAEHGDYDPRALDVWSCAIVCFTLFVRGSPWKAAKPEDPHYSKFLAGWHKFLLRNPDGVISDEESPFCGRIFTTFPKKGMNQLILKMLHPDPEVRISIEEALNDRCIKTIDCCSPDIDHETDTDTIFNAVYKDSLRAARKKMQKMHRHLPPGEKRL